MRHHDRAHATGLARILTASVGRRGVPFVPVDINRVF
jgi:hypothetical protein